MNIPHVIPPAVTGTASIKRTSSVQKTGSVSAPVEELMEELKNDYKHIHFDFIDFKNKDQIKNYAASQQGISNVVISQTLLEKMMSDESLLTKVKDILDSLSEYQKDSMIEAFLADKKLTGTGLIIDENGEVSKWIKTENQPEKPAAVPELPAPDFSSFYASKSSKKNPCATPYKYSQSYQMLRLANAKNVASVRGLIASGYSEIGKVKLKVTDKNEAAAIIRKIKAVIHSGNIKIARLHKEERLFREEQFAAKRQKIQLERRLAEQLRKKKIARKAQEHCQTSSFDDIFQKPSVNNEKDRQISGHYTPASTGAESLPLSAAVPMPAAPTAPAPAQITIAPVATIDCSV